MALNKLEKVRVNMWAKKLCQVTVNSVWKRNRNSYARTLLEMLELGKLQTPFDRLPQQGHLPIIQTTQTTFKRPSTSMKPTSPKGTFKPMISKLLSEPNLRRTQTPVSTPKSSIMLEAIQLKAQNELISEELKEARLTTLLIKTQLAVKTTQRRDEIIKQQREVIEELREELGFNRDTSTHHAEHPEESEFIEYLDSFQKEAVTTT